MESSGKTKFLQGKIGQCQAALPWRRKWQPTPVFLPGESHGQRSLAGSSVHGVARVGHDLTTKLLLLSSSGPSLSLIVASVSQLASLASVYLPGPLRVHDP